MKVHPYIDHMWRDLNFSMQYEGDMCCVIQAPVTAGLCNDQGVVGVGFISTLFDLVAGELAAKTASPDWIATADLALYSKQRARTGELVAIATVLRSGPSSVVIEADILAKTEGSASVSIGSAMAAFSRMRSREDTTRVSPVNGTHKPFSLEARDPGVLKDILGKAGLRVLDEAQGVVEINMSDYVINSFDALHGGMFGVLASAAGQCAARAVSRRPLVTSDIAIRYLSMGRVGPFYTRARVLRVTGDSVLTRIEILDKGRKDLLMAVAMNSATIV